MLASLHHLLIECIELKSGGSVMYQSKANKTVATVAALKPTSKPRLRFRVIPLST